MNQILGGSLVWGHPLNRDFLDVYSIVANNDALVSDYIS